MFDNLLVATDGTCVLGSVAQSVVHYAHCAVTVVR